MYETLAEVNKGLVLAGFISAYVTILLMVRRTWPGIQESWPMRAIFISQISVAALYTVNTLTLYFGDSYPLRELVRFLVYSGIPAAQILLTVVIATFTAGNVPPLPAYVPRTRKSAKAGKKRINQPPTVGPSGGAGDSGASDH